MDLNTISPEDLSYDEYGKWGRPGGRRIYMQPDEKGTLKKVAEGKEPASPWTVLVRCNRYVHESVQSGVFSKVTYLPRDHHGNIAIGVAVITYSVGIDPREVKPLAHKLSLDQESPFQRVKPSTLKLAKDALSSQTPKRALLTVLGNKGGIASEGTPTDFPRNTRQLRELKHDSKIPGKSVTGAGRPAKGNVEELLKMMQCADSFVRDCSTVAPEKDGDPLCFRVFLADRRGLDVFKRKIAIFFILTS